MEYVYVYQDDILIEGENQEFNDRRLCEVLKRVSKNGFRFNKVKCLLIKAEVPFLAHVISVDGINPDTKDVKDLLDAPRPVDITEINSFLGLANYYSEFIPDFATLAEPLRKERRNIQLDLGL